MVRWFHKYFTFEKTELELTGLDPEELGYLDKETRREILEAVGLNPDEYDF